VHQILPSLHVADASGAHTLHARQALRAAGFASEVFVEHVDEALAGEAHHVDELDAHVVEGRTALVYQLAVGSAVVDRLMGRSEPLIVNYHNLTPASFFWPWAPAWLDAVEAGRHQLHRLASKACHAIAVSDFNRRDLQGAGYRSTSVVPPFVDVAGLAPIHQSLPRPPTRPGGDGPQWLWVGKLLPHKAAHDIVKALAMYRRSFEPGASLVLVGGHPVASYASALAGYVHALGLDGAVELTGSVSPGELAARYGTSDVLVCLSEHEGFFFPLLEAMYHGVPVVAYDAGAVADTVGTAGLVVGAKAPSQVAAAVHRVRDDAALRARLVAAGRSRVGEFDLERTKDRFVEEVCRVLGRVLPHAAGRRAS
jgi:glycosyltransferase involved in cell wall biosynthesis